MFNLNDLIPATSAIFNISLLWWLLKKPKVRSPFFVELMKTLTIENVSYINLKGSKDAFGLCLKLPDSKGKYFDYINIYKGSNKEYEIKYHEGCTNFLSTLSKKEQTIVTKRLNELFQIKLKELNVENAERFKT